MTALKDTDDTDPNPGEKRFRLCDRDSLPQAKSVMTLFAWGMEQIEPKMDVEFTVALSVEFWTALSKISKPSVWAYGPRLINTATEQECRKGTKLSNNSRDIS